MRTSSGWFVSRKDRNRSISRRVGHSRLSVAGAATLDARDPEHEAAVDDIAAVYLDHTGLCEDLRDLPFRVGAVMHRAGVVDPASLVVGPQDLRFPVPIGRVAVDLAGAVASSGVGQDGPEFAVGACYQGRFVVEEDQLFTGLSIAQAAAQWFPTLTDKPGALAPRRAGIICQRSFENSGRKGMNAEGIE